MTEIPGDRVAELKLHPNARGALPMSGERVVSSDPVPGDSRRLRIVHQSKSHVRLVTLYRPIDIETCPWELESSVAMASVAPRPALDRIPTKSPEFHLAERNTADRVTGELHFGAWAPVGSSPMLPLESLLLAIENAKADTWGSSEQRRATLIRLHMRMLTLTSDPHVHMRLFGAAFAA